MALGLHVRIAGLVPRMERVPPGLRDRREQANTCTDSNQKLRGCKLLQEMGRITNPSRTTTEGIKPLLKPDLHPPFLPTWETPGKWLLYTALTSPRPSGN